MTKNCLSKKRKWGTSKKITAKNAENANKQNKHNALGCNSEFYFWFQLLVLCTKKLKF